MVMDKYNEELHERVMKRMHGKKMRKKWKKERKDKERNMYSEVLRDA